MYYGDATRPWHTYKHSAENRNVGLPIHDNLSYALQCKLNRMTGINAVEAYRVSSQDRVSFSRKIWSRVWVTNAGMPPLPLILIG